MNRLGLKLRNKGRLWTEEEKDFIRKNYKKIPTREIARLLNRNIDAIINSAGPLGISAGRPRPWTESEKKYLQENYGTTPLNEIVAFLGRSKQAIIAQAAKSNLTKKRIRKNISN